jgi:hypothetical protein
VKSFRSKNWELVPLKILGFSLFFEGKAYYFVGKDGWNEAANGATKKDLTDVKQ